MKSYKTVKFEDAQQLAKKYPNTFSAPSQKNLDNIQVDTFVKVCVSDERFWVKVTKIIKDKLCGIIDNDLIFFDIHGLNCGDKINFYKKNIYQILGK
jgi:hypothetical protein